jgi:predicted anti-sigma-YlaC factor YlaD
MKCTYTESHHFLQGQREVGGIMSCKATIHLICMYLEGRLSPSVETDIRQHLDKCSDCRLVLDAAMSTLDRYFTPERTEKAPAESQAA